MNAIQISWVLAADDSARLATFYSELFQAKLKQRWGSAEHHCIVQGQRWHRAGDLQALTPALFPLPVGERWRPALRLPHRSHPCLNCNGCSATPCSVVDRFLEEARLEPFGAEAWIHDPEGNPLLLLVPLVAVAGDIMTRLQIWRTAVQLHRL